MSPIPFPGIIAINSTLKEGSVYLFKELAFNADHPHFFVVLNVTPDVATILVMVNATSQVVKRKLWIAKNGIDPLTLVETDQNTCEFLEKVTVFDCNSPRLYLKQDIVQKYDNGELKMIGEVPDTLLRRLRDGVRRSKLVSKDIKNQI